MSGALNSVFGGGNIFGALLSIASIAFPPMAIASSLTNLFTTALQTAVNLALDKLTSEFGMPRFVADIVRNAVDNAVSQNQQPSDPSVDQFVQTNAGSAASDWASGFADRLVTSAIRQQASATQASGSGKKSAGSWLEAIAIAMAEAMSSKSAQMIDLSAEISKLSADGKSIDVKDTKSLKENSEAINIAQARLSAAGKEFEMLTNTMKSVVDSIGNALTQAARKG